VSRTGTAHGTTGTDTTPEPSERQDAGAVAEGPVVEVSQVSKTYGHGPAAVHALAGIDLRIDRGGFLCLIGASGCGKSTLLNLLAGLDQPTAGTVDVQGRTALMFQDANLFPWLTVAGNVELALRLRGVARQERRSRARDLLATVHLDGFADKRPHELSGGMRQRVAFARAFAQDAEVLLMDEPFGALDAMTRDVLHAELEHLWTERDLTVVFVTHNVREAARLADRIVVLSSRPGSVITSFDVDAPRPRRMEAPGVASLAGEITEVLRSEVSRHVS
jgi:NitT/TauT family transport system ATP-binding protein